MSFHPVRLTQYTKDLASLFRSSIERSGIGELFLLHRLVGSIVD